MEWHRSAILGLVVVWPKHRQALEWHWSGIGVALEWHFWPCRCFGQNTDKRKWHFGIEKWHWSGIGVALEWHWSGIGGLVGVLAKKTPTRPKMLLQCHSNATPMPLQCHSNATPQPQFHLQIDFFTYGAYRLGLFSLTVHVELGRFGKRWGLSTTTVHVQPPPPWSMADYMQVELGHYFVLLWGVLA